MHGHFEGSKQAELWGLANHPTEEKFASCGADSTVRIWTENEMVAASKQFPADLTAIDWSSDGKFLIVGDRTGNIYSVTADAKLKAVGKSAGSLAGKKNAWVQDVKIAPNSKLACFGTHGGLSKVEVVSIGADLELKKAASINLGITSALTHLDWTMDSSVVVINSQAYELMWVDVKSKQRVNASSAKDLDYASWTCILGFPV